MAVRSRPKAASKAEREFRRVTRDAIRAFEKTDPRPLRGSAGFDAWAERAEAAARRRAAGAAS